MGVREISVGGGKKIVIEEMEEVCEAGTGRVLTGSWVWESSLILSQWITTQRDFDLRGKTVLELGAGAGLPGLVAATLGATRVVLTDIDPLIPALSRNVVANNLGNVVEVRELVWGSNDSFGDFDLVLMSDVFFDPEAMGALARTLKTVCGDHTTVWAATEVRPWTGECLNVLTSLGFGVLELSGSLGLLDSHPEPSELFAVFCVVALDEAGHVPPAFYSVCG
ncbi:hypothetical protein RJT34_05553 [Clitoria ternatea]|uniref:Uncharacterized protein n=1 Tax=Clitoria ternatea TaxID=43366 RepID=A0AAN9K337_CLITE